MSALSKTVELLRDPREALQDENRMLVAMLVHLARKEGGKLTFSRDLLADLDLSRPEYVIMVSETYRSVEFLTPRLV